MEFKKIKKEDIVNSTSYIVATGILNMTGEFNVDDVYELLNGKVNDIYGEDLKVYIEEKLRTLMNNGSVIQRDGYYYSCRLNGILC